MSPTLISWTHETWNPVTGCSHCSEGCRHCYAELLSLRRKWSLLPWTARNAKQNVILHPDRLRIPYKLREGSMVFTNSMSDMFHKQVPDEFLQQMFAVMTDPFIIHVHRLTFQNLTKHGADNGRLAKWPGPWTPNIWQGVTIEDRRAMKRLDALRDCGAAVKFVSFEPLLEDLGRDLNLRGIQWAIVGGESGPGYRHMRHEWARRIRDKAVASKCAFFFKQDSAFRTETRPYLIHEDGTCWKWQQYPGNLAKPIQVPPQEVE